MTVDGLNLVELAAPLLFVLGAIYLLGPILPLDKSWARLTVFALVWLVVGRYLFWRLTETVWPAQGAWYEVGWIWFCFAIELFAIADAMILYLIFLRRTDRSAEADRHEAALRMEMPHRLPSVDVFIPTYNESFDVLEKTITGALCLDYPNFKLWILDDGRREWLKDFCEKKGVGYLTRPDNSHAKAGNINHALLQTDGEFIAVFDADFIPKRNFLMRTLGFFEDPKVGIVQVPHAFYNNDPMQANLALRKTLPDDQRFFFEAIMPSRDGWDAAFCCGSNSVTRRTALNAVGGQLPTDSITEDMLLTLELLRNGFVTRYLCERLAFGLAPESLKAFFVQRQRWARGAMQILYLKAGPFGPGLSLMQRLMFLPTHWISQGCMLLLAVVAPLVYLWTGLLPLINVTLESVLYYLVPMMLAIVGGIWVYAPKQYFPFAAQVLGTFQSFKILPPALKTMISPFGHVFKVTPKGRDAGGSNYERSVFWISAGLMIFTVLGLVINTIPELQIIQNSGLLPTVAFWSAINIVTLFLVCMMSLQTPLRRVEERFPMREKIAFFDSTGTFASGETRNFSLSGVAIDASNDRDLRVSVGERLNLYISEVGFVAGRVARRSGRFFSVHFDLPPSIERDLMIRKLFTSGVAATEVQASALSATGAILGTIWSNRASSAKQEPAVETASAPVIKLPARTLVMQPRAIDTSLREISEERRSLAG